MFPFRNGALQGRRTQLPRDAETSHAGIFQTVLMQSPFILVPKLTDRVPLTCANAPDLPQTKKAALFGRETKATQHTSSRFQGGSEKRLKGHSGWPGLADHMRHVY